ncbi:anti-sigma factor [Cryptosporangium arvum]|uniref:Regulator of SigK n=1 Tax=Cryptosporangium arvum DSM 44712 TaxID=927661 RepID=A0A010YLL6_9ACTN|nr:anti-sigma factor [Cryptosporangium arvum]EXG81115.1 Anti-sigma-K factor rskA [Cryptosporangium arvum DSM 44712]
MTSATNHVDQLLGAYALDAMDDVERAAVERHLRTCPTCAAEAAELTATTARLGAAAVTTPPPHLRARVLGAAQRTAQHHRAARRPAPRRRRGAAAAAAAVVLVSSVGGTWWAQENRITHERARVIAAEQESADIRAVLTASDAEFRVAANLPSGHLAAVYSSSHRAAVVTFADLGDVPAGKTYQFWRLIGQNPRSLGALPEGTRRGSLIVHDLNGTDQIAVSIENAGGAPVPTKVHAVLPLT